MFSKRFSIQKGPTMNQQRLPSIDMTGKAPAGAFDKRPQQPIPAVKEAPAALPVQQSAVPAEPVQSQPVRTSKEDFPDIFKQQDEMIRNVRTKTPEADQSEMDIEKINKALSGGNDEVDEELVKISPEDI